MYEIIIKQTITQVKKERFWRRLDTEEVERKGSYYVNDPDEPKTRIKDIDGWTPEIEVEEEVEQELFRQKVSDLDLNKVIKAVNGIE